MTRTWIFIGLALLFACNKENNQIIDQILLSVDQESVILGRGAFALSAKVFDQNGQEITDRIPTFYVNENPLQGSFFEPNVKGTFSLTARINDIISNTITVEVLSIEEDLESLVLKYPIPPYLTTASWSATFPFQFAAILQGESYPIEGSDIQLFVDGEQVDQSTPLHFDLPGSYTVQAHFRNQKSNELTFQVRAYEELPIQRIPIVFHTIGIAPDATKIKKLIDTLNRVYFQPSFSRGQILTQAINPNAVGMQIEFFLAEVPPPGFSLHSPGIHVVIPESESIPQLDYQWFQSVEKDQSWPTETYVNVWLADFFEFELTQEEMDGFAWGRGFTNLPLIKEKRLSGLSTFTDSTTNGPTSRGPVNTTRGIILNAGSVFGEHPDFMVNMMGHFLGLHSTAAFDCNTANDYCNDTPSLDLTAGNSDGLLATCTGERIVPSNFMGAGRKYSHFTLDQRERVRFVLVYGVDRPK